MTKAEMHNEIARLSLALYQAKLDMLTAAERTADQGPHWTRGYLEQAAESVRNALEFKR